MHHSADHLVVTEERGQANAGQAKIASLSPSRADMPEVTDTDEQIVMAKLAYGAYGQTTDFKNYQGNPMPKWDDLGDTIQAAWVSAANAIAGYLMGPPAVDELTRPVD